MLFRNSRRKGIRTDFRPLASKELQIQNTQFQHNIPWFPSFKCQIKYKTPNIRAVPIIKLQVASELNL